MNINDKNIKKKRTVSEKTDPNAESGFLINPENKSPTMFMMFFI